MEVPGFAVLGLPQQLEDVAELREGIVLVSGPRASGKSSTLAALVDRINEQRACHIITVEDPIEFLHNHKRATVHQRELHSDTPTFELGLQAALRQAPQVILVSELRDRRTLEISLEAAETGHLVLSSLNAVDAVKTVDRVIGMFSSGEQTSVRGRLAKTLRCVISQRLLPRRDGNGRIAAVEILRNTARVRKCIEREAQPGQGLLQAMREGAAEGLQPLDSSLRQLLREGLVSSEVASACAADPQTLLV
jgi:twitching motility protein PilT